MDYDEEFYEDFEFENACDHCGPWCADWGGDGLCMLVIEEQSKMRLEYEEQHIRKGKCPVCGRYLSEYDVYAGEKAEPWTWNVGWYYPILGVEILGPLWLKKGVMHQEGRVFHVWIEWGDGKEERLLRYLTKDEALKDKIFAEA